jgi:hypothetical protein
MEKLLNSLNKQLKSKYNSDAEDCLKIYNYLKEINDGVIWENQWNNLISTSFEGSYPNSIRISKLNYIGKLFLEGLNKQININTLPTAKDFLNRDESGVFTDVDIVRVMIDFAKLHLEAAQKAWFEIINKRLVTDKGITYLENAYPLDLIK